MIDIVKLANIVLEKKKHYLAGMEPEHSSQNFGGIYGTG
jgi:hypothetical protein